MGATRAARVPWNFTREFHPTGTSICPWWPWPPDTRHGSGTAAAQSPRLRPPRGSGLGGASSSAARCRSAMAPPACASLRWFPRWPSPRRPWGRRVQESCPSISPRASYAWAPLPRLLAFRANGRFSRRNPRLGAHGLPPRLDITRALHAR